MRTPSGHYDRECLLAVTGRVPLELVHDAELIEAAKRPAGCTGDCEGQRDCTCSHALAWRAPRQPRIPTKQRSSWGRTLRAFVCWLRSPRSDFLGID